MEKLKSYGLAVAVCGAALTQLASGDANFDVGVNKFHYFTSAVTSRFGSGYFSAHMVDGGYSLQFCYGYGGFPDRQGIDPIGCPLGTTAYVVGGDLNGDGVQDVAGYWSVISPIPAVYAEPFRPDRIRLSAWPGTLPQLQNFKDLSSRIYYNLFTPESFRQYNISEYYVERDYEAAPSDSRSGVGALVQMNKEAPPGQYVFEFPGVKRIESQPDYSVFPNVTINAFIEAFGQARYNAGFRFTSGTWDPYFYYQMDPRVTTKFTWTGNTPDVIRPGVDALKLAVFAEDSFSFVYPVADSSFYIDLVSPLNTSYIMPSTVFRVGDRDELSVKFIRNGAGARPAASDSSFRDFRAKLRMVDSYAGYVTLNFPQGSVASKTTATADYDKDGVSNLIEFATEYPTAEQISAAAKSEGFGDGADKAVVIGWPLAHVPPVQDPLTHVALTAVASLDSEKHLVCMVPKRPLSGTTLTPTFSIEVPSASSTPRFKKLTYGPGKDWDLVLNIPDGSTVPDPINPDFQGTPETVTPTMRVQRLNTITGRLVISEEPTPPITLTPTFWKLRSKDPVADPDAPLPNFKVTLTTTALK